MLAQTLIPDPDVLPLTGPVWLFRLLLHVTFLLHLLAMNLLLGGTLIGIVERLRGGPATLAARLERRAPTLMALTVTFGVAPLLFLQVLYGHLFYTSSILMAWPWLLVVPALIVLYYIAYARAFRADAPGIITRLLGWVLLLGLMAVAFVFVNNLTLAMRPERWAEMYSADPSGFHANLDDPTLVPRFVHFLIAAIAVSGLFLAIEGCRHMRVDPEEGRRMLRVGANWFLWPTALQFLAGMWFLLSLPPDVTRAFLGADPSATFTMALAILTAMVAIIGVASAIWHPRPGRRVAASALALLVTLGGMIHTRDTVRQLMLEPHFALDSLEAKPQTDVILIFVGLFALGVLVVLWMTRMYFTSPAPRASSE